MFDKSAILPGCSRPTKATANPKQATQQGAAPDRLQLRSFLTSLPAAGELGRSTAALAARKLEVNIYRIFREDNFGYDEYDSAVVIAESEEAARLIQPGGSGWVRAELVKVELIGIAKQGSESGVVLGSYNAG